MARIICSSSVKYLLIESNVLFLLPYGVCHWYINRGRFSGDTPAPLARSFAPCTPIFRKHSVGLFGCLQLRLRFGIGRYPVLAKTRDIEHHCCPLFVKVEIHAL